MAKADVGITQTAIPCDCGCGVVVVVDYEPYGEDLADKAWLDFMFRWYDVRLRARLRTAWRVLRGKDPWLHSVCLNADGKRQLREALSEGGR